MNFVFGAEGGYVNDPVDIGGPTNLGVTQGTYDDYRKQQGLPIQNVSLITRPEAVNLYKTVFWDGCGCGELPEKVALIHFDAAINHGKGLAPSFLADAQSLSDGSEMGVARKYLELREQFYYQIVKNNPGQSKFLQGWLNRIQNLRSKVGL
jgi:lysozyme family protein